jgi:hypothetical protein
VKHVLADATKDNVILFPKTLDYYQIELTRMLETERYGEALELLEFLLSCQTEDPRSHGEWLSLREWLGSMEINPSIGIDKEEEDEEVEETEKDLFRQHLKLKTEADNNYVQNLLASLMHELPLEKQLLALEQLTYIEDERINPTLIEWLETTQLFAPIQFKVLQTLKSRGVTGRIYILKQHEKIRLEIAETPLSTREFPPNLSEIIKRVQKVSEVKDPSLSYFAEQTWSEFLAYIYGTNTYELLLSLDEYEIGTWAAALHLVLSELLIGSVEEAEIRELYAITSESQKQWKQACQALRLFTTGQTLK